MNRNHAEFTAEQIHYYPFHINDHLRVFYVLKGTIQINNVSGNVILNEGDIEFISINEPAEILALTPDNLVLGMNIQRDYLVKINSNIDYLILNVSASQFFSSRERHLTSQNIHNTKHLKSMFMGLYREALIETAQNVDAKNLEIFCQFAVDHFNDIKKLILCLPNSNEHTLQRFQRIDLYLQKNLREKVRLDYLVETEGLSSQYLSAQIKNKYRRTFSNILEYYRVTAAMRMMVKGEGTITDIVQNCGFSDDKYFYKAWKNLLGYTPSTFRKKLMDDGPSVTRFLKVSIDQLPHIFYASEYDGVNKARFSEIMHGYYATAMEVAGFVHQCRCLFTPGFHSEIRIESDEIWFFHSGDSLELSITRGAHPSVPIFVLGESEIPEGGPSMALKKGDLVSFSVKPFSRSTLISRILPL